MTDMEDTIEMPSNIHITAVIEQVERVRGKHNISRDN